MQDDSQNQGTQSNYFMDLFKQLSGFGGNQDTMQPTQFQQLNMSPYAPKAPSFMDQAGMQNTMVAMVQTQLLTLLSWIKCLVTKTVTSKELGWLLL